MLGLFVASQERSFADGYAISDFKITRTAFDRGEMLNFHFRDYALILRRCSTTTSPSPFAGGSCGFFQVKLFRINSELSIELLSELLELFEICRKVVS